MKRSAVLIGIDLAWGENKRDGVCIINIGRHSQSLVGFSYTLGDEQLLETVVQASRDGGTVFATIDAPIICPNRTGMRPVDRLTHRLFHREHAACYPANATLCKRPQRILRKLVRMGFTAGWDIGAGSRTVAEVYPHPAMVRFFCLSRTLKYKRGPVTARRQQFRKLQHLVRFFLAEHVPSLEIGQEAERLLKSSWSKPVEDLTDALVCTLIGLWHWKYSGRRSEVIGDLRHGFILLPEDLRTSSGPPQTVRKGVRT